MKYISLQYARSLLCFIVIFILNSTGIAQSPYFSTSETNAQIFQAIRLGDSKKLESLLNNGGNANGVSGDYSALMAAALNGTAEEMKILIKHGADVNYLNKDSISAIWLAVPDIEKSRLLLDHGANADARCRDGNNVLVKLASIPGSARLMQLLIDRGCDVHKSGRANDIMFNAAGTDDTAMVGLLIRNGVSVNDTCSVGDYAINFATNFRSFQTLKMLVDSGANVNASPKVGILPLFAGITPLMWAAVSNDKPSFYYLLQHGADAKAKTPRGYTTLMFLGMSEEDDPAMTQALIDHGASPTAKANDTSDALYYAALKGKTKSTEILTKYLNK